MKAPRLVIGGTGSGCGKTTMTCALLQAFLDNELDTAAFKCGPDYIDPMFHSKIIGARSRNLDTFLCGEKTVSTLFANSAGKDISVIEGVMGYYDGIAGTTSRNSTADIARLLHAPTVLTVSVRGMSLSLAALLKGFVEFEENTIQGVLLNGVSPMMTDYYASIVEQNTGLKVFGALPHDASCAIESRHLGLVTAGEIADLQCKVQRLAQHARDGIDLDGLLQLANMAPPLSADAMQLPHCKTVRIAMARDEAFCFDYADSLWVLEQMGAKLIPFSPLHDCTLPDDIDGLLLCGGYPELYTKQLSENTTLLQQIRCAIEHGMPTIAECGGFLLLHDTLDSYPMAGVCGGNAEMTKKLRQFGYITLTAQTDNMLCEAGETLTAHEFHYAQSTQQGDCFHAEKPLRKRGWNCVHAGKTYYAGYPHIHFAGNLHAAQRFLTACAGFREERYDTGTDIAQHQTAE